MTLTAEQPAHDETVLQPPQLELRGVHAGYGRIEVLRDLSLAVPAGTVVALLGPNGAGKTTTLSTIAGILPVTGGDVLLRGRSIRSLSAYERSSRGVVLIPEGRGLFGAHSEEENLELFVRATGLSGGERRHRLEEVLVTFPRLRERLAQRAGTMSGGEQQMLALSRAFLSDPTVLLMDEISMGLAPQLVDDLFRAVGTLRDRGLTIVLVEQFLTYALRFADLCYVLGKGSVTFVGEPHEIRAGAGVGYLDGTG
jgi:branched-chain amino acid transport system ATP-binding protein